VLVKLREESRQQLHQRQLFEKNWLVAKGHWFSLVDTRACDQARACYNALEEEMLFSVHQSMLIAQQGERHLLHPGSAVAFMRQHRCLVREHRFVLVEDACDGIVNSL